jgi:hypothetical protein
MLCRSARHGIVESSGTEESDLRSSALRRKPGADMKNWSRGGRGGRGGGISGWSSARFSDFHTTRRASPPRKSEPWRGFTGFADSTKHLKTDRHVHLWLKHQLAPEWPDSSYG